MRVVALFAGGLAYAWFMTQGLPLWDDDFTSWFSKIHDQSFGAIFWEWVSPVSTQPEHWGFNERPFQKLAYKTLHSLFGYEGWAYFLFKDFAYAGIGVLIYLWSLRLVPATRAGRLAAMSAAIFFWLAPGPMAALVLHADYAPVAELLFLGLTFVLWEQVERTPRSSDWSGWPQWAELDQRRWLLRWCGLSFITYLAYKAKADLKLIPAILGIYIACVRRDQVRLFALPVALMALLAVPWGCGIFIHLPPFVPGSQGSDISWMWQPASLSRLRDFFWSSQGYDLVQTLREPTLSLAAILGPFLLVPLAVFLVWRVEGIEKVRCLRLENAEDRARLFVLLWCAAIGIAISALAPINYTFRIRYGILTMVPLSLGLGWFFGLVARSLTEGRKRLPTWAVAGLVLAFAVQSSVNFGRSANYRRTLGGVMVATDQLYAFVAANYPVGRLVMFPDFRPYDVAPEAPSVLKQRRWIKDGVELIDQKYPEGLTLGVSWNPPIWERLEFVRRFSGCRAETVFDRLFACDATAGAWLVRFVGVDRDYVQAEVLRSNGDAAGSLRLYEGFKKRHPENPAGYFMEGLQAFHLKDFVRADQDFAWLETRLPAQTSVLFNRATALESLGRFAEAAERWQRLASQDPSSSSSFIRLYWARRNGGQLDQAQSLLLKLKHEFPSDPEVNRLLSGG